MNKLIVAAVLVAFAGADVSHLLRSGAGIGPESQAAVLRSDLDITPEGSYSYGYDTENGISAQENGQQVASQEGGNSAKGRFSYTSPEGLPVVLEYVADENGYQPSSNVLPVGPPIPPEILKSLQYNAEHPEEEEEPPKPSQKLIPRFF